jgi:hypothetical protein
MPFRRRLYTALLAATVSFAVLTVHRVIAVEPVNDQFFPFCAASALLHGVDPYGEACIIAYRGQIYPPNPLTTVLAVIPFTPLGEFGPLMLASCLTGLLVFGLLKDGAWWRLLVLLSAPYWQAFLFLQWSPLILAITFLPACLPLALIKPQTGLPVILTNLTWRRGLACALFLGLTLIVDPTWPLRWLPHTRAYNGYIPVLAFPVGLLLLFTLLRWRDKCGRFLFLMAIVPQREIYDLLSLWSVLETPKQVMLLNILSWLLYGLVWLKAPLAFPLLSVGLIYLPLLALVLRIPMTKPVQSVEAQPPS